MAEERRFSQDGALKVRAGKITAWLKEEFQLGHGHSMATYALLKDTKNEARA